MRKKLQRPSPLAQEMSQPADVPKQKLEEKLLRQRAEVALQNIVKFSPERMKSLSTEEVLQILHELRVHQIELEMQNDELRSAQEQLDASRERYFDLYDLAPIGYCIVSKKGLILESNLTLSKLLGTHRSSLNLQPFSRYICKEDQDKFYLFRRQLFNANGESKECELRMIKNKDVIFWAQVSGTISHFTNDGAPVCRLMLNDISDRKTAEIKQAQLFKEVNNLKMALDAHAIVGITDVRGKITYANEKFCTISKYSLEELIGQDHRILNSGLHSKEFISGLWRTISSGHVWKGEMRNRAKDRTFYWVDSTIVPFCDEQGLLSSYVSIRIDITQQKIAEQEAIQASRRASMSEMSAGIAHEINNPLAIILGSVDLLQKYLANPEKLGTTIESIQKSCARIGNIVKSLSKYNHSNKRLNFKSNSLIEIIKAVRVLTISKTKEYDIKVNFEFQSDSPIICDAAEIEQVLVNLMNNSITAVKDQKEKWINFEISENNHSILLKITDSGIGIPYHVQDKIFDPFFTTQKQGAGMGLGWGWDLP